MKFKLSIKNLGSFRSARTPQVYECTYLQFWKHVLSNNQNSLLNNKNINAVENKKTAGPVDFKIDPWGSEQKNLSLYSLELTLNT